MISNGSINKDYCNSDIYILSAIVDNGKGSRVLKLCRRVGVKGGTICLGEGAIGRAMFTGIEIPTVRREIVIMVVSRTQATAAIDILNSKMKLQKPRHGIVFKFALGELFGSRHCQAIEDENLKEEKEVTDITHQAIFIIVDRGHAETVIEAAETAGARGATIINARGAGAHETSKLFNMIVEPEKEIVLIITDKKRTASITTAIRATTELDEPGKGILFVVDLTETVGLY